MMIGHGAVIIIGSLHEKVIFILTLYAFCQTCRGLEIFDVILQLTVIYTFSIWRLCKCLQVCSF